MTIFKDIVNKLSDRWSKKQVGAAKASGEYADKVRAAVKTVRKNKEDFKSRTSKMVPEMANKEWQKMKDRAGSAQDIVTAHKNRLKFK